MDDVIAITQGDPTQQTRVSELVLRALRETYPSLSSELKDYIILKKALGEMGNGSRSRRLSGG